ncbi:GYD domain-containing protein [Roseomonas terrae]|uniref:GYD domain-containing protein n=1 Tax=Neoroseomonas terrae TaxID=424799 RepID=A0ABS5EL59_9PROT|nr:GYD domain-containing protein [Neoroseomonas terrae]MBR0651743.1 GYD domain-containing protein [Neoroseomonas terrae]
MGTYIMFGSWTDQGISAIAESPRRLDAAKGMLSEMGGKMHGFYMTMGECDMVAIYEAPDDAVSARFSLMLGRMGNVRTRTVKAFPEETTRQIIASLG